MAVDPALWALADVIESGVPWPRPNCPDCGDGHIRFGDLTPIRSQDSVRALGEPWFEPEQIRGTFAIHGECENPECRQAVHGSGDFHTETSRAAPQIEERFYEGYYYSEFYRLAHVHPPMLLMPIPKSAPAEVRDGVLRASRALFVDPGLAATALRATVEAFLTSEGVPTAKKNGRGFRNLHERIEEWRDSDPANTVRVSVAELFFATKWLGNSGAHGNAGLTTVEVLDDASVLDEALHRLFHGPDIDARAQTINTAKGRVPKVTEA